MAKYMNCKDMRKYTERNKNKMKLNYYNEQGTRIFKY